MPLGPQLMRVMQISPREFSSLVAAYTLSASAASFLAALYIDRFDRKRALSFLYTGFALSTLLCGLATGYAALLVARLLAGAFGGVCGAAVFAVIGDAIPLERRGSATGTVSMAFSISAAGSPPPSLRATSDVSPTDMASRDWRPHAILDGGSDRGGLYSARNRDFAANLLKRPTPS